MQVLWFEVRHYSNYRLHIHQTENLVYLIDKIET